jgi:short-subunit dehydrogenase
VATLEDYGRELKKEFQIDYRAVEVNLADPDFLRPLEAATRNLDVGLVISNAGGIAYGEFLAVDPADWERNLRLNVISHLKLVHRYGRDLAKRGRGGVLLVSSMAGLQGTPYMSDYSAAKAYLINLGEALHFELRKSGIHVTVLIPGPTDTPMLANSGTDPKDVPMKPMSAQRCAKEGLAALASNRATHLPGRLNRAMMALIPRSVRPAMMGAMVAKGYERLKSLEVNQSAAGR